MKREGSGQPLPYLLVKRVVKKGTGRHREAREKREVASVRAAKVQKAQTTTGDDTRWVETTRVEGGALLVVVCMAAGESPGPPREIWLIRYN